MRFGNYRGSYRCRPFAWGCGGGSQKLDSSCCLVIFTRDSCLLEWCWNYCSDRIARRSRRIWRGTCRRSFWVGWDRVGMSRFLRVGRGGRHAPCMDNHWGKLGEFGSLSLPPPLEKSPPKIISSRIRIRCASILVRLFRWCFFVGFCWWTYRLLLGTFLFSFS